MFSFSTKAWGSTGVEWKQTNDHTMDDLSTPLNDLIEFLKIIKHFLVLLKEEHISSLEALCA